MAEITFRATLKPFEFEMMCDGTNAKEAERVQLEVVGAPVYDEDEEEEASA